MDLGLVIQPVTAEWLLPHVIPYAILLINYLLFKLMRSFVGKLFAYHMIGRQPNKKRQTNASGQTGGVVSSSSQRAKGGGSSSRRLVKLFADELISTCELCADCAELNVVYEKHGSLAYGLSLFILTYLWMETFGDAHTTPGYLAEDYFLIKGNELLKTGDLYARFIGQSLAMPLAWRMASVYWRHQLISEHQSLLDVASCKSSLATSTMNGFLIEFVCCLMCRLSELVGHKLLERRYLSQRVVSVICSFICSLLVVLSLELSGGYFNPVLAASLEYGCKGIQFHQHALVFWLGPLLGHVVARAIFRRYSGELANKQPEASKSKRATSPEASGATKDYYRQHRQQSAATGRRRSTRSNRKRSDKID